MNENKEYEVIVEKFDNEGRGISYVNGVITFIDGAIPKDRVIINLTKIKKKYCTATVKKIISASENRIKPLCPYFNECGGCDLQSVSYDNQLKFKENKIKEIMYKFASIDSDKIKPILALKNNNFYYRNKITFQVKKEIGLFSKNSYELINIDKCFLVPDNINSILSYIKKNINLENINQVVIRYSFYNSKIMIIFDCNSYEENNIKKLSSVVNSLYVKVNDSYKLIYGDSYLEEKLGDYIFKISPDSFFQVNTKMCIELYNKIIEYGDFRKTDNVLDLYCGTGTIGIYISKFVNRVIGYEINEYAVKDAEYNKDCNLVDNIEFFCGTSELSFENITNKINKIIVDPPRSGLNEKTINGIISVKPCKVIYVSCDPITLSRDIKILSEFYDVLEITPVDMFPNTKHVECVCILKRKQTLEI